MKAFSFLKVLIGVSVLIGAVCATATMANRHDYPPVDAVAQLDAEVPASKVKFVGRLHNFDLYDIKATGEHGDGDFSFPMVVDGVTYADELDLAAQLKPLSTDSQHLQGVSCNMFCWNENGDVIGYNPAAYAALARGLGKPTVPTKG